MWKRITKTSNSVHRIWSTSIGWAAQFGYDLQQGCTNPWGNIFCIVMPIIFGTITTDFTPTYKNVYHLTCDEQKASNNNRFTGHPRIVGLQHGNWWHPSGVYNLEVGPGILKICVPLIYRIPFIWLFFYAVTWLQPNYWKRCLSTHEERATIIS